MEKHMPLDKSWIIRMGILDLINGYNDIIKFLNKQEKLSDDLLALKKVAEDWNSNKPLDVGESGTLYRFVRFALWKLGKDREIIKRGTLRNRNICNNKDIINWPIDMLLKLDNGTSQWASASILLGNKEKPENPPFKLKLTYQAVKHWEEQRSKNLCWLPFYDETIENQALAYINLLKTDKINFIPEHSEDYCFARAFELITPEKAKTKWPSLIGHETNRILEMEKAIQQADNNQLIDSKDHRVIQAIVMRQKAKKKGINILYTDSVNKSWPEFWDFVNFI